MGKIGRFACIFTPMALSLASLLTLVFVEVGTTSLDGTAGSIYFMKADLTDFRRDPTAIEGTDLDDNFINLAAEKKNLRDYYQVGLWNYCSWNVNKKGKETNEHCSDRERNFYFDPRAVWGLNSETAKSAFGDNLNDAMDAYKKAAGWMFTAYALAFFITIAEIVVGFFALFSRWGSFITTIISGLSTLFTIGAAASSTAIFLALVGAFHTALEPYHIDASVGGKAIGLSWLAAAFSIASGFFWFLSVCCCSGKSSSPANVGHKYTAAEKTPYTYERVHSPMLGQHGGPNNPHESTSFHGGNSAYEPYRHAV